MHESLAHSALTLACCRRPARRPWFRYQVARPTFTNLRPRVAIDEAHQNFHTADGRYKPFADLMTNDGFLVSAQHGPTYQPGTRTLSTFW